MDRLKAEKLVPDRVIKKYDELLDREQ